MLFLPNEESPIFILFPISGTLHDVGALLTGAAVLIAKRWSGWRICGWDDYDASRISSCIRLG